MKYCLVLLSILLSFTCLAQQDTAEVFLLSTLHRAHNNNPNYTYEHLDSIVLHYNPDILAVEVRPEDLNQTNEYLNKFYPKEMTKYLYSKPNVKYYGFDWFGDDIKGKPATEYYFNEVNVMRILQKQLSNDSIAKAKLTILQPILEHKKKLILHSSFQDFINGKYDVLSDIYYQQLKILLANTPYIGIYDYSMQRDEAIAQNIATIIKENPNKKILILMGADHRNFTKQYLNSRKDLIFQFVQPKFK